jgi:hypothetical protein
MTFGRCDVKRTALIIITDIDAGTYRPPYQHKGSETTQRVEWEIPLVKASFIAERSPLKAPASRDV